MPVHEFPILDCYGNRPPRSNYWGYDPLCFFAPHRGYAVSNEPGSQVREFKEMVRALHAADIEVILDVVFNHTAEGNEHGPTLSLKGLENRVYYMLENGGQYYRNYTGCGNTLNGNHPIVREMIFDCLRHWVHNYHVDGFRFDLASILSRDREGNLLPNPPVVETISEDPQLADTKIIAEAWDAAGAYQVGTFGSCVGRVERPLSRRRPPFLAGRSEHDRAAGHAAGRIERPLPGQRPPALSQHQLHHLARRLHPQRPGELQLEAQRGQRREQSRRRQQQLQLQLRQRGRFHAAGDRDARIRQIKNFMATNLLSQGVPMIVFGDECRRTQQGNNNAYCQDNAVSWFDWRLVQRNEALFRFVRALIAFRRREPTTRQTDFLTRPARPSGRTARCELVQSVGRAGGLVARRQQPDVRFGGRSAEGRAGPAQSPPGANAARRGGPPGVCLPQARAIVRLAAVPQHWCAVAEGYLS